MSSSFDVIRVYNPDTLKLMAVAFGVAVSAGKRKDSERARRKLTLLVLRYVDRGEHDPMRLADMALLDFLR